MKLYDFQKEALEQSKDFNKVAYYYDMGLGKTFIGAEKLIRLNARVNLVVCQKSKVEDWIAHFKDNYKIKAFDLTKKDVYEAFIFGDFPAVAVINYDLLFRRPELARLKDFTLLLDESSLIQNDQSKRSKFIMRNLHPANIILLSGTPTGGKYETLWSQLYLLGYKVTKSFYWEEFINYFVDDRFGFPLKIVTGYKNTDILKQRMREHGCFFMKTEDVYSLPEQNFIRTVVLASPEYKNFRKNKICKINGKLLVGDTTFNEFLYSRLLCGAYSEAKINKLKALLQSSDNRFVVFYNFNLELDVIKAICEELKKPISIVNGDVKDLTNFRNKNNAVAIIQYKAGAMGLNLQAANQIIYFTPYLSSEYFEQSKKRIHRIGQKKPCFYYQLICAGSVEEKIYATLALRKDYTEKLFEKEMSNG